MSVITQPTCVQTLQPFRSPPLQRLRGQQLIRVAAFFGKSLLAAALLWLVLAAPGFLAR